MSGVVLDTSAVLAMLKTEPGAQAVEEAIISSDPVLMSAVNLAEVLTVLSRQSVPRDAAVAGLRTLGISLVPFGEAQAIAVGRIEPSVRRAGISLGDRACLILAQARGLPVLTADRAWAALDFGVEVRLIR